ncbi:hypothetical protein L7F22_032614 [Adiantum nelumboides]|nr:hypothetical protein [Adiantum nelumboides]
MQVGGQSASSTYIRMKKQAAEECGMKFTHVQLPEGTSEKESFQESRLLKRRSFCRWSFSPITFGDHINADAERRVTEAVSPNKDSLEDRYRRKSSLALLKSKNCTVTQVHSKTKDLPAHLAEADIVVAAMGKTEYVKGSWLKKGAVVIDVGTNYVADESKKSGQRLVGDVEFSSASEVASAITPVPGE